MIPRILLERQGFLNFSEESLREEIERQNGNVEDAELETGDYEEAETPQVEETPSEEDDPLETFNKQKFELSKNINAALNETSLSLDFVSLLVSSIKPSIGKSTMSPHLLNNIPLGSLNSDRLGNDETVEVVNEKTSSKVGELWKLESINKITSLFKTASTSLEQQITREEKYWNIISLVKSNDEVLFKTRDPVDQSRSIGVKYGYEDSGATYYEKGLSVLRKDQSTGKTSFHALTLNKLNQKAFKYLKVKILSKIDNDDEYMITGQSQFKKTFDGQFDIINEIEKARYFLFEEDLFYQLTREAKTLINYNVSIINNNKIIIEINNEIVEIESVAFDDEEDTQDQQDIQYHVNNYSTINSRKCELILNYLKLMLCCFYKYNLELKQKIPTVHTKWKQSNSHPLLLRPLIGNIRHDLNITSMESITNHLLGKYKDDLESVKVDLEKLSNLKTRSSNPFQKAIERPTTIFNIVLANKQGKHLKIDLKLSTSEIFVNLIISLTAIKFGCEEDFENNVLGLNVLLINFNDFNDIEECLDWFILGFIQE